MAMRGSINGYTAWSNMRLVRGDCEAENILRDIMAGRRMKVLLEEIVGTAPKRLDTLDGLSASQKVTRVDWFIDALKASDKLPHSMKVDSQMFSLHSADHVFPVLWKFVCLDVISTWKIAPLFQKHSEPHILIAEPLESGPSRITNITSGKPLPFYISANGKSITQLYKRASKQRLKAGAKALLIELVNGQLKMTVDGRKLYVEDLEDLVDSRILCSLVNSLIPGSFTSEVLLSDRWTINLALKTTSEILRVKSLVDSGDLYMNDEEGVCAFLTYFIMAGYQFRQAEAVLKKLEELKLRKEDLIKTLGSLKAGSTKQEKQIDSKLARIEEEKQWITDVYNIGECSAWVSHANQLQANVRLTIARKMQERFDVLTVPRPMTINKLIESLVVNLSLTGGCGFYCSDGKETLSSGRKIVIRDKDTGEFFDDFSGCENPKGSVRVMLKLHPYEVVEVNAGSFTKFEVFFESLSRNKILKAGSKFLYQVFPGTTSQCHRLLLRASKVGELTTVKKLLVFFKNNKSFVNCCDPETGNTALHLASRHGHFDIALLLLESGSNVNTQNSPGCSPFFLSTEGLHKTLSHLLIEWGADIHLKNKVSKTALELIRNSDLREFLKKECADHKDLIARVAAGDTKYFEQCINAHVCKENLLASLRSRCVRGDTMLHIAASLGSTVAVEMLLAEHVDPNILNEDGATSLHLARDPAIIRSLVAQGADVSIQNIHGNSPLHMMCQDKAKAADVPECISIMAGNEALLDVENDKGLLPIHCAASHGLVSAIETLLSLDENGSQQRSLEDKQHGKTTRPSLMYLSMVKDHLACARWLAEQGHMLEHGEADKLALRILSGPPPGCHDPVEAFQFLLQHGANPDAEYTDDNRPLHLSTSLVNVPEITDMLIDGGGNVDLQNSYLATPLFTACKANNPSIASRLIKKGASCHTKDIHGKSAFDYVEDHSEWIDSGYFTEEVKARLKAYSLKHARDLVNSISKVVKTTKLK